MDESTFDFGEAFGQKVATPEDVITMLINEYNMGEGEARLYVRELFPDVETVANKIHEIVMNLPKP